MVAWQWWKRGRTGQASIRLLVTFQGGDHLHEVPSPVHRVGVVKAEAGLTDGEGALVQAAGAVQVALIEHDVGEIVKALGRGGVVGPERSGHALEDAAVGGAAGAVMSPASR